jgi:hypothetical protein
MSGTLRRTVRRLTAAALVLGLGLLPASAGLHTHVAFGTDGSGKAGGQTCPACALVRAEAEPSVVCLGVAPPAAPIRTVSDEPPVRIELRRERPSAPRAPPTAA